LTYTQYNGGDTKIGSDGRAVVTTDIANSNQEANEESSPKQLIRRIQEMASTPILGCVYIFAGNFAPRGYQLCQGQLLPISQNSALFAILGTTYGGNGTTTFALPDLRGRAPIGAGQGPGLPDVLLGEIAGTQSVTILTSNLPPHTHAVLATNSGGSLPNPGGNVLAPGFDTNGNATTDYAPPTPPPTAPMAPQSIGLTGSGIPISVQNPFLGINYIIAVQGIFPSRN